MLPKKVWFSQMNKPYERYHKLLGISPRDQPPTAYRLLGIDLFESDREVIDAAANKQMGYLQSCCNGKHAVAAEGLLNEVAEARLRLLSPASKAQYDQELRATLGKQPWDVANQSVVAAPVIHTHSRGRRKRSSSLGRMLSIFVPTLLSILLGWKIGWIDFSRIAKKISQEKPATSMESTSLNSDDGSSLSPLTMQRPTRANASAPAGQFDTNRTGSPTFLTNPSSDPSLPINDKPAANTGSNTTDDSMKSSEDRARLDSFTAMGRELYESARSGNGSPAAHQYNGPKIPVPEDELESTRRSLQEILASQILDTKSSHDQQHFATVCYQLAMEADGPAEIYVLLQMAQEYFVDGNDCTGAMLACDAREARFQVDLFSDRIVILKKLVPPMYRPLDQVAAADRAEAMISKAIRREDYEAAIELCEVARKLAVELRNISMSRKFAMQMDKASLLQKVQPKVDEYRLELERDPDNAAINEYLGRVLCFGKSDWADGLPFMQRGENAKLSEIATLELNFPTSAGARDELADRWWNLAVVSENDAMLASASQERAVHWYRQSIAAGLNGLARAAARSRLDQYESEHTDQIAAQTAPNVDMREPEQPRGVPPNAIYFNGNWYLFSEKVVRFQEAVTIANQAGGRLVVVRSQAEHDFLVQHSRGPLMLGMLRRDGVWYDSLGEKQYFFLWDRGNRQPDATSSDIVAAIDDRTQLWHDHTNAKLYFAIEWGNE